MGATLVLVAAILLSVATSQGPEGTAVVRGRVVDGASGKPLRNLSVHFNPQPRFPYTPGIDPEPPSRSALTDANGAFDVARLVAGEYAIYAGTAGDYLSIEYGMSRAGGAGKHLIVPDGAQMDIVIKAWRGASITGQIVDERGRPIVEARVQAVAKDSTRYGSATTDDRGVYEIARLRPGRYAVAVPISLSNRTLNASPPARQGSYAPAISPYVLDRGARTILMPYGAPLPPAADDGHAQVYATAFFGGASNRASAVYLTLTPGESRTNVDITLAAVRGTRVSGIVSSPSKIAGTILTLTPEGSSESDEDGRIDATASADGSFVFVATAPGKYTLTARRRAPPLTEVTLVNGAPSLAQDDVILRDMEDLWAEIPVMIGDADIDDIAVALRAGSAISGRVVLEDEGPEYPRAFEPRVALAPSSQENSLDDRYPHIDQNGFVSMRLKPGSYWLLSQGSTQGRTFRTAIVDGHEIGDGPLVVGTEPISDVQFVFTRAGLVLGGTVSDRAGNPAGNAAVVVFPVDRSRWFRLDESARAGIARAVNGRYAVVGLLPGEYYAVAVDDFRDSLSSASLEPLVEYAARVVMRSGEPATLNLVMRPPDR
jgi:protocatechuate 3,4-dioxygenase beta subunit